MSNQEQVQVTPHVTHCEAGEEIAHKALRFLTAGSVDSADRLQGVATSPALQQPPPPQVTGNLAGWLAGWLAQGANTPFVGSAA